MLKRFPTLTGLVLLAVAVLMGVGLAAMVLFGIFNTIAMIITG